MLPFVLVASVLIGACSGDDADPTSSTEPAPTSAPSTTEASGPPPGAIETGWSDIEVGMCFDPIDDPVADDLAVWLIACERPHLYEVFDLVDYAGPGSDGSGFPGVAAVQNWSEEACFERFEGFVGTRWTLSELDIVVWWPSEDSWARGDSTVVCAVMDHSGATVEGSQRGSQR